MGKQRGLTLWQNEDVHLRTDTLLKRTVSNAFWTFETNSPMITPTIIHSNMSGVSRRSKMLSCPANAGIIEVSIQNEYRTSHDACL
jgi:hypothetical protein